MNVPFLDLKSTFVELQSEIDEAIQRVLHSGNSIGGAQAEALENTFAGFCGARHVVVVANGLDALKLALQALYVGPGNEVIVPSYTFFGIWLAVNHCGATPLLVEPPRCGFNIDPQRVVDRITPKTKETIPVHSYGEPVDLDPLIDIAERHGMFVLEDAAQTLRAVYGGRRIGSHRHAVAWSFYPGKNLGAFGDGGAVSPQVESLARRIRILGNYGFRTQYINDAIGYNRHLDHVQVAIMGAKLPRIDEWNARRHAIAERCDRAFGTLLPTPPIPLERQGHAWHLYVVRHPYRARLQQQLADAWVTTLNHHPCASKPAGSVRHFGARCRQLAVSRAVRLPSSESTDRPAPHPSPGRSSHRGCHQVRGKDAHCINYPGSTSSPQHAHERHYAPSTSTDTIYA